MKINNLILELNSSCNSNCIYCYLPKREDNDPKTMTFFKEAIRKSSGKGIGNIDFTGGEPTLYAPLPDLVSFARAQGFKNRTLVSNGRMLSYDDYCARLVESGITRAVISLDGPDEKISSMISRSPGSFTQSTRAIQNLKHQGVEVGVTVVINRINMEHLEMMAQLCISLGVDFLNFQHILPYVEDKEVACRRLPSSIIPSYKESTKHLLKAITAHSKDIKMNVHFIPPCQIPGFEELALSETIKNDRLAVNYKGHEYNIGEHLLLDAFKKKSCSRCQYDARCIGFFKSYAKEFGVDNDE